MATVLVVDNDFEPYIPLKHELEREGHRVRFRPYEALMARPELGEHSDLIIIGSEISAPEHLALCLKLRGAAIGAPIIITAERYSEEEAVAALDGGADYYLTEPVCAKELLARIHALLRRHRPSSWETAHRVGSSSVHLGVI